MAEKTSLGSGGGSPDPERRQSQLQTPSSRWASLFGGEGVTAGPRIAQLPEFVRRDLSDSEDSSSAILNKQLAAEQGEQIQYPLVHGRRLLVCFSASTFVLPL